MNVLGYSGLSNSVAFKRKELPGLSEREYRVGQGFDAAAALVGPDGIVAAAAEERFTGEKATGAFPIQAIQYCLEAGKLSPEDVDLVAHGFDYEPFKALFTAEDYTRRQYHEVFSPDVQRAFLEKHFPGVNWSAKFVPVAHHLAHAASAFYPSGFEEALIVVSDGMGEAHSLTVALGRGNNISVLKQAPAFHSLGILYSVFTLYLGFYMGSDEYKVMGLAPYGDPNRFLDQVSEFVSLKEDGTYTIPLFAQNRTLIEAETHRGVLRILAERFGAPREPESEITQLHRDIAAALQAVLQKCQLHVLHHFRQATGLKHLCLAGGVALNCSANGVIQRSGLFERVFVQPAAGDDGSALGAALYAQRLHDPKTARPRMTVPLWGPEFTPEEIRRVLAGRDDCDVVELESFDALCQEVAARINRGQIVAWFQGRMEFGPRALGNRSILADPRDPTMRDRINGLVKKREGFRPFAPVATQEAAARIFELKRGQEDHYAHMLFVTQVRPEFRDRLPATTHVDGSARVQTVCEEQNAPLWRLLREFEKLSGMPVLLNTSFNVRGQPIVRTPQEAVETFLGAHLDLLVAGNFLVTPCKCAKANGATVPQLVSAGLIVETNGKPAPEALSPRASVGLLVELNSGNGSVPNHTCITDLIAVQAEKSPSAVAVVFEDQQLSYSELNQKANQLARYLQRLNVGPEVLVGICTEVSLDMLIAMLGVLKAGGAYVPLDPDYPKERLGFMIRDARLPVILTQRKLAGLLHEVMAMADQPISANDPKPALDARVVCLDSQWPLIELEESSRPVSQAAAQNLAYVIYTSGSTGKPKGVMVTHGNVINFFTGMDRCIGGEPPGVWLAVTSISFDISVLELFWTLARGFKVVLQRRQPPAVHAPSRSRNRTTTPTEFSLFYFASSEAAQDTQKYRLLIEGAKFADEHGFSAVWTPERHFHAFGGLFPNPSVTSAALATITRRVQIRAGSVVLPLHNPIRVAEEWAVVDNLSGGRTGISFASGWQVNDFVLAPHNYAQRKEQMVRQIEIVRRLWRGETVDFPGPDGRNVPVKLLPRPIQNELPIWITASGDPETFRLAGHLGANLLTHLLGQSLTELARKIAIYRAAWEQAGHPEQGQVTLMLHTFVGHDLDVVRETVRQPLTAYLRSSIDLLKNEPWAFSGLKRPADAGLGVPKSGPAQFSEAEIAAIANHAFERYFDTNGLFGTPKVCLQMIQQVQALGVDEIAALIDFGVPADSVLASLEVLDQVKTAVGRMSSRSSDDTSFAALVKRHCVTHFQCTPSLAAMLVEDAKSLHALRSLRKLMLGGEALSADLVRRLAMPGRILNMYGPTETTVWSATHPVTGDEKRVPIGRPIANTEILILDLDSKPVPQGVAGEMFIGGLGVARGYLNRPELTTERFIQHPLSSEPGARLYRTGDLARYLPDESIEFLGRRDQQVKLRGFRIELGEVETALRRHPAIKDCVAVIRQDTPGDHRLAAYFVAAPASSPTAKLLRKFLQEKLPEYMVPSIFLPLPALPLTPNGKLDRQALPIPGSEQKTPAPANAPDPAIEEQIRVIWRQLLGIENIEPHDHFFELGGHSLLATQLIVRLRELFRLDLPLRLVFEFPVLDELARAVGATAQEQRLANLPLPERIAPRVALEEVPLSFAQHRLWFLHQLEPGPQYNDHFDLRLTGPLRISILERALNEIVRRHDTLRSSFAKIDGSPVQRIAPMLELKLALVDLSHLSARERENEAARLAIENYRQLFDLEEGPLLRLKLLRLAAQEHVLLLTLHHIIVDGWSRGVLLRELTTLYHVFSQGRTSPLADLPIQYADFAAWQQSWLEGDSIQGLLAYWKQRLKNVPPLLELPTDRPRPVLQSYDGARRSIAINQELTDQLTALGQQQGCTLFMVLLGAFQTLLARYSHTTDIVVGTPIANRTRTEVEGLIGYFLNSLVLRTDLSGDPSFIEVLQRVRTVCLEAYAHQDLPFERLVAELQPTRDLALTPLFQVMFVLQNTPKPDGRAGDLECTAFEIDGGVSKFDLTLNLEATAEGCVGWIEYATALFDPSTIDRLIEYFKPLLNAIAASPDARLSQLPLFPSGPESSLSTHFDNQSNGKNDPAANVETREVPAKIEGHTPRSAGSRGLRQLPISTQPLAWSRPGFSFEVGKLDASETVEIPMEPGRGIIEGVAGIWSEVLGVEKAELNETIFDLGGHSLLITKIISRIHRAFEVELPIQAFFETPTLGEIADRVESLIEEKAGSALPCA